MIKEFPLISQQIQNIKIEELEKPYKKIYVKFGICENCGETFRYLKKVSPPRKYCFECSCKINYNSKYYKEKYGKDEKYTEMMRRNSRKSVNKFYHKNSKRLQKERMEIIKSNPEMYLKERLRSSVKSMFRIYIKTGKIMSSIKYGINYSELVESLKPFPEDLSKYHIDHIRPLCSFKLLNEDGTQNFEEIKKAFSPENLRWLLKEENIKKNAQDRLLSINRLK